MEITEEMLISAMKKAIELELFPRFINQNEYAQYWDGMEKVLEAALNESEG